MGALENISDLVAARYGLRLDPLSVETLAHRLKERAVATGSADLDAYAALLARTPAMTGEWEALLDVVTVHETYFFRDEAQMEAVRTEVLPQLAERRARDRRLRILSAGCSTGEEAYSLAILVLETKLFDGWDVSIVGTDVSQRCVKAAREGSYRAASFRLPNPAPHAFVQERDRVKVRPLYADLCDFHRHNLLEPIPLVAAGTFDLVFCRNVLLYFREEARARLVGHLARYLRDDGWLFLGHAETMPKEVPLTGTFVKGALAYRRTSGSSSSERPARSKP